MNWYRYFILMALILGIFGSAYAQEQSAPPMVKPFIMPVAGPSSPSTWVMGQPYGNTTGAYATGARQYSAGQYLHFGIDISMPCGTPLVAVADGEVASVDNLNRGSAPHNLLLRFPDLNLTVLYGHLLQRPTLVAGQPVRQGEFVALSGDPTGECDSRPHLHFEVRSLNYAIAYNPIEYIEAPWNSLVGLGAQGRLLFQRDLTNPRRWMSLEDQPDVRFGGARLNNYTITLPQSFNRRALSGTPSERPFTPVNDAWTMRQLGAAGCCAGVWWHATNSNLLYILDGVEGQIASIWEIPIDGSTLPTIIQNAPPPILSADGTHEIIYEEDKTTVRRLSDGMEWYFLLPGTFPSLSPDNHMLLWSVGDTFREIWVGALDGSFSQMVWSSTGRDASARWLDGNHLLITEDEPRPGRRSTLLVVDILDLSSYSLGTWNYIRSLHIAPGGERFIFFSMFNEDSSLDGTYAVDLAAGASVQKLPWFADYRWRDAESVYYITFDPATDIQQLNYYHVPSGESYPLTDPNLMPFTIANGDWSVSPDGNVIAYQEARDGNLWLLESVPEIAGSAAE